MKTPSVEKAIDTVIELPQEIGKYYSFKDAKKDSQAAIKDYRDRQLMKLHKENTAYFGDVIRCGFLSLGIIGLTATFV